MTNSFPYLLGCALLATSSTSYAVLSFSGSPATIFGITYPTPIAEQVTEGGTDGVLDVGDAWKFNNVTTGVDAIISISSFTSDGTISINSGGGTLSGVPVPSPLVDDSGQILENVFGEQTTPTAGYDSAIAVEFNMQNYTTATISFSLSFVDSTTEAPVNLTEMFTVLDLDTAAGNVVERVGIGQSTVSSYGISDTTLLTDEGLSGGYYRFSSSTATSPANRDVEDFNDQRDVSVEFLMDGQSSIDLEWHVTRDTSGTNTRTFYLSGISEFDLVPEPSSSSLFLISLGMMMVYRRR